MACFSSVVVRYRGLVSGVTCFSQIQIGLARDNSGLVNGVTLFSSVGLVALLREHVNV